MHTRLQIAVQIFACLQQAGRNTLCKQANDRCLALRGIAPSMLAIAAKACFVTPVYLSLLPLRPSDDGRVGLIQPPFDLASRCSPACLLRQGLLRGETPTLESLAHCPERHSPMQTLPEQRLNRPASPQRKAHPCRDVGDRVASGTKAELILLRRLVAEQNLALLLLPRAQRALLTRLTPSRLGVDTPNPFSLIRLPPIRYRIAAHFQLRRYRNITHALLSHSQYI